MRNHTETEHDTCGRAVRAEGCGQGAEDEPVGVLEEAHPPDAGLEPLFRHAAGVQQPCEGAVCSMGT